MIRVTKTAVACGVIGVCASSFILWGIGGRFLWPWSLVGMAVGVAIGQALVFAGVGLLNRRRMSHFDETV